MDSMQTMRRRGRERHELDERMGEAWIDAVGDMIGAEAEMYTMGLRYCRRMTVAMVQTAAQMMTTMATMATGTVMSASAEAEQTEQAAMSAMREATPETVPGRTMSRRRRTPPQTSNGTPTLPAHALEAFTVEQLDRLASARNVEGYPQSGSKAEKTDALAAARIDLDALTIEQLDRIADAWDVDDYPETGSKREKIVALADTVGMAAQG